ncbi:hypothetical protein Hanom_Chr17g01569711 [Helianthus anomalus]
MSLITTAATPSQYLVERSQPEPTTPPASSQKEQVVSQGTPHYETFDSFESMLNSPPPRANSFSTPIPTSQILTSIKSLFDALRLKTVPLTNT